MFREYIEQAKFYLNKWMVLRHFLIWIKNNVYPARILSQFLVFTIVGILTLAEWFLDLELNLNICSSGGRGRIRTDERTKRADLQSASFSHLDTLPKVMPLN